jgi:2-keto-myo-inositol isomerase
MARALGVTEVEIRNDLPDVVGTMPPGVVKAEAE